MLPKFVIGQGIFLSHYFTRLGSVSYSYICVSNVERLFNICIRFHYIL